MHGANMEIQKTCDRYTRQIRSIDLKAISPKLGIAQDDAGYKILLFDTWFWFTPNGFVGTDGKAPGFETRIVLSKYFLMCPLVPPKEKEWTAYRDFKDAGPLTVYFKNDVEMNIVRAFEGKKEILANACAACGAETRKTPAGYDLVLRFNALPKIPMLLLFNDSDDEFDAAATLLFEKRADQYLDAECLAISGTLLFKALERNIR